MNKKQLTEKYYNVLNENWLGVLLRGLGFGAAFEAGSQAIEAAIDASSGTVSGSGRSSGLGRTAKKPQRQVSPERVDADVARSLASGDKEDYYDYLADLKNSDTSINKRTSSIIRTRALASNMAQNRAAQMKAFALSGKNEKGAAYLKAKAEYDAARKAYPDLDDASKDLSGTRPNGASFTIKGKTMSDKAKAAYEKMQQARKDALDQEYTIGDLEGKRPSNAAAEGFQEDERKASEMSDDIARARALAELDKKKKEKEAKDKGQNVPDPFGESFKNYYNILKEQDTGAGIGQVPGAAEGSPRVDEINKEAEEKRKAEEKAKKEAEEAENARLNTKVGSWSNQMAIANSLKQGPMNLQPVEVRGSQSKRKPFNYINPNSAEGRIEAQIKAGTMPDIWERDSSGRIIPGQGIGDRPQPSSSTRAQPSTATRPQPTTNVDKPSEALDDLSAAKAAHKEFENAIAFEYQKARGKALSPEANSRLDALQKKSAERVKNLRKHTTNPDIIKKFDTTFPAWQKYYNP